MKSRKSLLFAALFACVVLVGLAAGAWYLYRHPSIVVDWIESELSERTGLAVSAGELNWSANPLELVSRDVLITSSGAEKTLEARIANLKLNSRITGPFRNRTLIIEALTLDTFSLRIDPRFSLGDYPRQTGEPGLAVRLLKWLMKTFLFAKVQIDQVNLLKGHIQVQADNRTVELYDINGYTEQLNRVRVNGEVRIAGLPAEIQVRSSNWILDLQLADLDHFKGEILLPSATLANPMGRLELSDIQLQFGYERPNQRWVISGFRLDSPELELFQAANRSATLGPLSFSATGVFDNAQKRLNLSKWHLSYRSTLQGQGQADLLLDNGFPLAVNVVDSRMSSEALQRLLIDDFHLELPARLEGTVTLTGRLQKTAGWNAGNWEAQLTIGLLDNRFEYTLDALGLEGLLTGGIQVIGPLDDAQIQARLNSRQTVLKSPYGNTKPFPADLALGGSHPRYRIDRMTAALPAVLVRNAGRTISLENIDLILHEANIDVQNGSYACSSIRLDSDLLKNLRARISGNREGVRIRIDGSDSGLISVARRFDALPSNWSIDGSDRFELLLEWNAGQPFKVNGSGRLSGITFQNPDDSCIGENLTLNGRLQAVFDHDSRSATAWRMNADLDAGEVLCGKHYLDFASNRMRVDGQGDWNADRNAIHVSNLQLDLKQLVTIELNGVLETGAKKETMQLGARITANEIVNVYDIFVREPYQYERPGVNLLEVDGPVEADISLHRQADRWQVTGAARWTDGRLAIPEMNMELAGIDLDLPVWYSAGLQQRPSDRLSGRLSIQKMTVPFLPDQTLDINLQARANALRIPDPTQINIDTGKLILGPVDIEFPQQAPSGLKTNLALNDIPVATFIKDAWPNPLTGTINGRLTNVLLTNHHLTSEGRLQMNVFGGQIEIANPGVLNVFRSTPALILNAEVDKLDLAQMTGDTSFGKIEGALSGYIKHLQLVGGQPQHFDLRLETVKLKRRPQKINVRAIENIARLGGGASPFMGFAGTFAGLFKTFPYKKIGVAASLRNDVFKINGTIKENQTEYLVRRSGLSGVDVVNLNPDNRISFKDMLKRIQRIDAPSGGPVVR